MFGFGKVAITIPDLARRFAKIALSPLTDPTEQDSRFQDQAVKLGMVKVKFSLEASALQLFTLAACVKTRLQDRGIANEHATELLGEFMEAYQLQFLSQLPSSVTTEMTLQLGLPIEGAFDLTLARVDAYSRPEHASAPHKSIPYLFAQHCDVPDPDETLLRIGWSIFIGRGTYYVRELKKFKLIHG